MHIQNNNALIFWLGNFHTIVNDIVTLNTSNTLSNYGKRNLVHTIKTLDTQLNQLSTCTHESLTSLLAFQPDRVNNQGDPLMTDLLASHLEPIKQDIRNIKKQLKPAPPHNAPIRTPATPWTTALGECQALANELKREIIALQDHKILSETTSVNRDDINRAVLRTITTLLPTQDTPNETALFYEELTVSVAMNLTNHIENIINTAIDNYHTHQTNNLAINKISAASIALARSVQLKAIETDHKTLQEKYDFLSNLMEAMIARQTHMDSILATPSNPTLDTANMPRPSHIPPSVDQSQTARHMQDRDRDQPPHLSNHPTP